MIINVAVLGSCIKVKEIVKTKNTIFQEFKNRKRNKSKKTKYLKFQDLENYIKGKSVAFVGMAPTILNKGLGEEIDSHDIVFRTNMFPIPDNLQQDYGKKCNIISFQKNYMNRINNIDVDINIVNWPRDFKKPVYLFGPVKKRIITEYIKTLTKIDINYPTAGLTAYMLSIAAGAKSFKYYGVTGYQDLNNNIVNHDNCNHCVEEYQNSWLDKEKILETNMLTGTSHNFKEENKFRKMLIEQGLCDIDEYSKPYFQ